VAEEKEDPLVKGSVYLRREEYRRASAHAKLLGMRGFSESLSGRFLSIRLRLWSYTWRALMTGGTRGRPLKVRLRTGRGSGSTSQTGLTRSCSESLNSLLFGASTI